MLISVVVPVKNAVATIGRTLESLKCQTHSDFEVLIVDGGSTDGTIQAIESCGLPQTMLIHEPGSGISGAVNIGISRAKGDVVMPWLCADDYLDSNFLAAVAACWKRGNPDFVYGNWHAVVDGSVVKSRVSDVEWESRILYSMPRIMSNSFVFRRELFESEGPLDESLRYACDYEFVLRLVTRGFHGMHCSDAWYFYQVGGLSQRRFFEVALEVARASLKHGGRPVPAYWHLCKAYLRVKISFLLNEFRSAALQRG